LSPGGRAATWILSLGLAACAGVPPHTARDDDSTLSGRLALQVEAAASTPARSVNAAFELQGNAQSGRLSLLTPLGNVVARALWEPGQVVLNTPQGESRFADMASLSRDMLGESLPVAALFDWLRGRPWPGAPFVRAQPPAEPGFEQLGWVVSLARFDEAWISARREQAPGVTFRAKMDRP